MPSSIVPRSSHHFTSLYIYTRDAVNVDDTFPFALSRKRSWWNKIHYFVTLLPWIASHRSFPRHSVMLFKFLRKRSRLIRFRTIWNGRPWNEIYDANLLSDRFCSDSDPPIPRIRHNRDLRWISKTFLWLETKIKVLDKRNRALCAIWSRRELSITVV